MIPDVQRNEYETAYCGMNRVISAPKTRDVMNNLVVIERAIARREGERERGREEERERGREEDCMQATKISEDRNALL
jgi:hypothetical protein